LPQGLDARARRGGGFPVRCGRCRRGQAVDWAEANSGRVRIFDGRGKIFGDDRIVHGYFGIDDPILFTTIDQDLKPMVPRLEALARVQGAVP
jgi:hypothetical protein